MAERADGRVVYPSFGAGRGGRESPALSAGGGGGNMGNMPPPEERIAKLEVHVDSMSKAIDRLDRTVEAIRSRMDTDFRLTWGGMIVATLGLAALMAKGFKWI